MMGGSCPSLSGVLNNKIFLQNLPSVLAGHALNIQPGHHVLDMCAAPGGKSTHIAQLLQGKVNINSYKSDHSFFGYIFIGDYKNYYRSDRLVPI